MAGLVPEEDGNPSYPSGAAKYKLMLPFWQVRDQHLVIHSRLLHLFVETSVSHNISIFFFLVFIVVDDDGGGR